MEDELTTIVTVHPEPLDRMKAALVCIRKFLQRQLQFITDHPFKDRQEEASYFKNIKPQFYYHYIFEVALYNLVTGLSCGDDESKRAYYHDELRFAQRTFKEHPFLYQYYRLGGNELDDLYFVRGVAVQSVLIPEVPELDSAFSTSGDYLFAKFKAYEMLQEYIAHELSNVGKANRVTFARPGKGAEPLKWTGDQVNAIELGYGIWLSGQLNKGDASLADIMYWLGQSLDIDLARHTRRFDEIKARKLVSQTRFTDNMRDAIRQHIDNANAFRPNVLRRANRTGSKSDE
ncbi:RteC domain-containing protein [Pedobacter jejuensis]|nr:RteC domain-containing protein [Pedobacter jejuensis]